MARFAVNDSRDHSATLWIVNFLLLSYTTLTTLMRGILKFSMLGVDDAVAGLAQLFVYGNVLSNIYALRHGLAKSAAQKKNGKNEPDHADALQASIIFYLLSLAAAKAVTILFLKRVFRQSSYIHTIRLCKIALAVVASWVVGSVVAVSTGCAATRFSQPHDDATCDENTTWMTVATFDGVTEIGLLGIVIFLVSHLQLTLWKKIGVCSAFAWRLGLVVMAVFHYRSYHRMRDSSNAKIAITEVIIWEQVSICYSLLSITWPFSKVFIKSFDTAQLTPARAYGSNSATVRSTTAKSRRRASSAKQSSKHPWQSYGLHSAAVYSRPADSKRDDASFGSQEMIIRREDEITVAYDQCERAAANPAN